MALIEHLEEDRWREVLRGSFDYALEVLRADRFRRVGSAVDDLRSWLAGGGMARVKEHLNQQMSARRFPAERQAAIHECLEQLARENRSKLLDLMAHAVIPPKPREILSTCGLTAEQFDEILRRITAGERPFEDWMHAHGHSDGQIAEIYNSIDAWLFQHGPGFRRLQVRVVIEHPA